MYSNFIANIPQLSIDWQISDGFLIHSDQASTFTRKFIIYLCI